MMMLIIVYDCSVCNYMIRLCNACDSYLPIVQFVDTVVNDHYTLVKILWIKTYRQPVAQVIF